jgi:hypothetical protein
MDTPDGVEVPAEMERDNIRDRIPGGQMQRVGGRREVAVMIRDAPLPPGGSGKTC